MKKVELLAPAGNYECFLAAVKAGADAVYLGGVKFGARAYADNFSVEEICKAVSYAHFWKRKVYLTLNTLLKDAEIDEAAEYVRPMYECGLDGVIVQDIGVFSLLKRQFPQLELHCSTQMSLTGKYGAAFAKELGASRIVPARELSLTEIEVIRRSVDIELETFIHGAMCYCYSGQCLFSSILGGRSGNRGKCAQPCRLPYKTEMKSSKEEYPLSLKDMCTIEHLPELIRAGISSFKIEGRMKRPEYVAGVTGIYRKYIDLYYENPNREWKISKEDLRILHALYIRSEVQDGYYFRSNGREMVTLKQPGYSGTDEAVLESIRKTYLSEPLKMPVEVTGSFRLYRPAKLTLSADGTEVTVFGPQGLPAKNMPVTEDVLKTQLSKMGNTDFSCVSLRINADENIFYPVKSINELRRDGVRALAQAILEKNCGTVKNRQFIRETSAIICLEDSKTGRKPEDGRGGNVYLSVKNKAQFQPLLDSPHIGCCDTLILDSAMCAEADARKEILALLAKLKEQGVTISVLLAMPYIIREKDTAFLEEMYQVLESEWISGCLFRNMETYYFLKEKKFGKRMVADANIYVFNSATFAFWQDRKVEVMFPYELNAGETRRLREKGVQGIKMVYGRIPLMITANCIQKTMSGCSADNAEHTLTDRYRISFPVLCECRHCYNIIYNSAPLSLHKNYAALLSASDCCLSFTTETPEEAAAVLHFFAGLLKGGGKETCPYGSYTTGHEKRGVE